MSVLISGYKGFIGTAVSNKLKSADYELFQCDIADGVDLTKWADVEKLPTADVVVHLANLTFVPASFANPTSFYKTNFLSTLHLLEYCRLHAARMIYFSSYMYGAPDYQPIDERHPTRAYNPYSQTKIIAESLCEGYNRDFGVPITIFRPFNIYGKGQNPDFLIPTIINQAKTGKITIKDDRPKRDYIHIKDIVGAVIKAIEQPQTTKEMQIYNLGSGVSYSVKEVIELVCGFYENKIDYTCTNEIRQNEVMNTIADISKIKRELGWQPMVSLEEGIRKLVEN